MGAITIEERIIRWAKANHPNDAFVAPDVAFALGTKTKQVGQILADMPEIDRAGFYTGNRGGHLVLWVLKEA
jgi:hypothetical protein